MRYHLVYRKNGRYDPVIDDVQLGIESIDQEVLNRTSPPTEVFLEVPRFLETSNTAERKIEITPAPIASSAKEFRPFSKELYNEYLYKNYPTLSSPYNNDLKEQTETKFKLPISEQYDPEGTKIDWRRMEQRITEKIREYKSRSREVEDIINIETQAKEEKGYITLKIDDASYEKGCSSIEAIESTANSIVNESIERAVTVAQDIIKEINTELNVTPEGQKLDEKNIYSRAQIEKKVLTNKDTVIDASLEDEKSDIPKSVKDSIHFYEAIDSQIQGALPNKEESLDDERKLFLIQEMKESIEAGSVRRQSEIFKKDVEMMKHSDGIEAKDIKFGTHSGTTKKNENTSINTLAQRKAFSIGLHTIGRIKKLAEETFVSKTLFKIFLLYLSSVMIVLTKPFYKRKFTRFTVNKDKKLTSYAKKKENIEMHTSERDFLVEDHQEVDKKVILRRRKLSGCEMAQLSSRKPEELTQRMETVISEFHSKLNIKDSQMQATVKHSNEQSRPCTEPVKSTSNSLDWLAKMDHEELEQVKKDIRLATLAAARRVAERRTGKVDLCDSKEFYEHYIKEFDSEQMDIATYIAIVESHVYTYKDAIFENYVTNLKAEYTDSIKLDHNTLETENVTTKSYKSSDHSKIHSNDLLLKRTDLAEEQMSDVTFKHSAESQAQDMELRTEYVATVTVEHKQVPIISSTETREIKAEVYEDTLEQKMLSISTAKTSAADEIKVKQIIVEYKDEAAEETNIEKIVTIETGQVAKDIGILNEGKICGLDEDQTESLTITEIPEETPSVTVEKELNIARAVGKETLRQVSADFTQVEVLNEKNFNLIQNEPESVKEENKLIIALIINKATIEEITLVFDEVIMEPICTTRPKEETAITETESRELINIKPIYNATVSNLNLNFIEAENIIIEPVETTQASDGVELERFSTIKATCTPTYEQFKLDIFEGHIFENEPAKEEKANIYDQMREFFSACIICNAFCQDIITSLMDADILNIEEVKHELALSNLEPQIFVAILAIATPYFTQISITYEEANAVESEQFQEEIAVITEEVKALYYGIIVCTAFCQYFELILEESNVFKVQDTSEEYSSSSIEPSLFTRTIPLSISIASEISINYVEADILLIEPILEETAKELVESNVFFISLAICTAVGETVNVPLEECKMFDVDMINKEIGSSSVEPEKFTKTLPIATHVYALTDTIYVESEEIYIDKFEEETANVCVQIDEFSTAPAICTSKCETVSINLEESKSFESAQIIEHKALERLAPKIFEKVFSTSVATASMLDIVYSVVPFREPEIFNEEHASIITEIRDFVRVQAVCQATTQQINLIFIEPELISLSYEIDEHFVNVLLESNQLTSAIKINNTVTNDLLLNYEMVHKYDSITLKEEHVTTSVQVPELELSSAINKAVVENLHINLYSLDNNEVDSFVSDNQVAIQTVVSNVHNVALPSVNATAQTISTAYENVETQVTKQAQIAGEKIITSFEAQQVAKALKMGIATAQDKYVFLEAAQSKQVEKNEVEIQRVDEIREADFLATIDTTKQALVLVKEEESEQKVSEKVTYQHLEEIQEADLQETIGARKQAVVLVEEGESEQEISEKVTYQDVEEIREADFVASINTTKQAVVLVKDEESEQEISEEVNYQRVDEIQEADLLETIDTTKQAVVLFKEEESEQESSEKVTYQHVEEIQEADFLETVDTTKQAVVLVKEVESDQNRSKKVTKRKTKKLQSTSESTELEEVAYNLSFQSAEKKEADYYQAVICKDSMSKTNDKKTYDSIQETLYFRKNESRKHSLVKEEFQMELINTEVDMEESERDSQIVIKEITDVDEISDDLINSRRPSHELSLQIVQVEETSNELEDVAVIEKYTKLEKVKAAIDESAALKIVKQEELELICPVLEVYEEDEDFTSVANMKNETQITEVAAESSALTLSSQLEEQTIDVKDIDQQLALSNVMESNLIYQSERTSADGRTEKIQKKKEKSVKALQSLTQESVTSSKVASTVSQKFKSEECKEQLSIKQSSEIALKSGSKHDHVEENIKSIESATDVLSPPPTPLVDEYVFRLVAPLPKSRGNTPVPIDPEPEPEQSASSPNDDPHIVKKNLKPVVESEICERVVYSPPLTSPPTSPVHSPVYTKPGLNGGTKRVLRYIKPGLRGGSDAPTITKEEILEVQRKSSILASEITETLKKIEKYKKEVGILKQEITTENQSEFVMEADEQNSNAKDKDDQAVERTELGEQKKDEVIVEKEQSQTTTTTGTDEIKLIPDKSIDKDVNVMNVGEKYDSYSDAFEEVTLVEDIVANAKRDHSETIEECFDFIENEPDITEGVVEFPNEVTTDSQQSKNQIAKELTPDRPENVESFEKPPSDERRLSKDETRTEGEANGTTRIEITTVEDTDKTKLDKTADEEVARVTALTADRDGIESKGRSPALSPREAELLKEARVISLTRVLSAHMLRESMSPDRQKIEADLKVKQEMPEEKKELSEGEKDRSWTTFLQKSTRPTPGQKLEHFADLQNKFEAKEQFVERTDVRIASEIKSKDFNSSPVPWQERALADSLGAPSVYKMEEPALTPGEPPEFLIAIPPDSLPNADQESSTHPLSPIRELPRIEIEHTVETEDASAVRMNVDKIIEEALKVADNLDIGEEKDKLIRLLSTNIKNITDSNFLVEEQLSQMRSQLKTLAQVPEIIRRALENLSEQLSVISHRRKEENLVYTEKVTERQPSEAQVKESNKEKEEVTKAVITQPQTKEVERSIAKVAEKMPAETRGDLRVTNKTPDVPRNHPRPSPHQPRPKKPEPKFGRLCPDTGDLILPGGRRWRRNREYDEQSIAETILAQSEIIQGKALGINFMKYEKPPIPLDHLQRSEVYKLVHDAVPTPPKRVEMLRPQIAEVDYRERCRSMSPCPPDSSKEQKPSDQLQP